MAITLDSPVETVLGDTKKSAKVVKNLGLRTVGDLLHHFPRRYLPTGELTSLEGLHEGEMLTVVGDLADTQVRSYTDRRTGRPAYRVETVLQTDGPRLRMTFFAKRQHIAEWNARRLAPGTRGVFLGKVGRFRQEWQLTNPQMVLFGDRAEEAEHADALMVVEQLTALFPIYPLTAGVESWDLMRAVRFARAMVEDLHDPVPDDLRGRYDVADLSTAMDWIHAPEDFEQVQGARHRFRFEEALTLQLVLARRRRTLAEQQTRRRDGGGGLLAAFDAGLPFSLTEGQQAVGEQLFTDLASSTPMNRLLQGEVGSGKTLVALRAMLRVVDSGGQAALLAPTEVLAQQHFRSITALLGDLARAGEFGAAEEATRLELLTGSMTKTQRREPLSRITTGEAGLVIGTHALLQDQVEFYDLGLVVVDEQHRFGVEQRAALTDKAGAPPHLLVMTATPIPRTVAMTVFGDLEVSTLTELPAGRAPIQSTVVPLAEQPQWLDRAWQRVREEVEKGHQAYVVCPRISADQPEQGETDQVDLDEEGNELALSDRPLAAVEDTAAMLAGGPLAGVRVGVLHGQLPAEEKERTMRAFAAGEVDVLVSTTVIEVGVDVANATTMVLLDADRFGVSQLHQLRGRVGRGGLPGLCLLVSAAEQGTPARTRVEAVAATSDGFELSRVDLDQRREGDVLGASQSGRRSSLENLRVLRDEDTIVAARRAAGELLDTDPALASAPLLADRVAALEGSDRSEFLERS
ncbi:ATP-dependent DNA helicase RecG [Nocardioides insulae]|uniref:ATP-dependent DNA helicase RecG n=1 Tax=Nocardioides insulae TaxID=394734 RepID=UPI0004141B04|nr:ATP-dependent DNA helicase RecG [Nocardioides insulae]